MSDFIKARLAKDKPHLLKTRKYLLDNDWTKLSVIESDEKGKKPYNPKEEEFNVQTLAVNIVIDRLKYFVNKSKADHHEAIFKKSVKEYLKVIDIHLNRIDNYVNNTSLAEIKTTDLKKEEMKFTSILTGKYNAIDDIISLLNIKEDTEDTTTIQFHENTKIAQLCMLDILYEEFPLIKRKIDAMGIDFTSPPKNEMHIDNPNPPKWNKEKHFFEQEVSVLKYYIEEFKKLRNGITIDGVEIEPWLYFHINHFVTEIPTTTINEITGEKKIGKKVRVPELRDNEWYIIQESYRQARKTEKILFIAATRRLFKSTGLASHLYHIAITGGKELVVAGGSAKDLGQLEKNIKVCSLNINPAFAVNNISNDWSKKIPLGIRTKANKIISQAVIHVINLDGGAGSNSEILAGFSPDAWVIDEIMKAPFIDQLNGAKPSFDTPNGKLCTPILSGTGGNEALSRDALIVLKEPTNYDILPMNWDALERGIPKEDITWKRQNFGTYAPAQMSAKTGMVKIQKNLEEYLEKTNCPNLRKIKILVTDWKTCNAIIKADREKLKKHKPSLTKEIVYYPISPEEIFLSGKTNPFPYELGNIHLERIRLKGNTGKKCDLVKDGNTITTPFSSKEIPKFPFEGGFHDSPVVFFGEIPTEKPPRGLYCMSLDDYKQEQSGTDSMGCFIIYKRQSGNDEMGDRIAAIYTSRPDPHRKFHNWGHMLCELYNVEGAVLMENEDMEFKVYLDTLRQTDKYLVPTFNIAADLAIKGNGRRQYGISPAGNKSAIINKALNYANEPIQMKDDKGEMYDTLGIERINDEMLLEEMINYKEGENHDRITTFGIALIQAHKMDAEYVPIRLVEPVHVQQQSTFTKSPIRMSGRRTRL